MTTSGQLTPNGEMIATRRRQRGLSRKAVAELVGRSDEWLRQIETGRRRLDSISCTIRLAEILRVDPGTLLGLKTGQAVQLTENATDNLLRPIRRTLMNSRSAIASSAERSSYNEENTFDSAVTEAWRGWLSQPDRYAAVTKVLPALLQETAVRTRHLSDKESELRSPIAAYQLACTVLERIGEHQLSWLAADRAMRIAEATEALDLQAIAAWHLAHCYLQSERPEEAYEFSLTAAERLPTGSDDSGEVILRGALYLIAAQAKAAQAELHFAETLLAEAKLISKQLVGDHQIGNISFGITEIGITSVQIAIRLGQLNEALRLAATVDMPDNYPLDGQVRHYIPLAYVHARRNEDAASVLALIKVAELSPEDIRYHEMARQTMDRLTRRNNLMVRRELIRLADLAKSSTTASWWPEPTIETS